MYVGVDVGVGVWVWVWMSVGGVCGCGCRCGCRCECVGVGVDECSWSVGVDDCRWSVGVGGGCKWGVHACMGVFHFISFQGLLYSGPLSPEGYFTESSVKIICT